jgi:ABC-type branched-subunit amino acid transport system substrate-binding protein
VQGALVRAGLEAWARDRGATLALEDDRSDPALAARLHAELRNRCRLVLGPYGSDSTRAVADSSGAVWNHGAAADDVQRLPGVASVPTPASRYLVALGRVVAAMRPGARTAVVAAPGRFAAFARAAFEREVATLGLELVAEPADAEAVLLCGPFEWELDRLRSLPRTKLLGGVSPGLTAIAERLDPEGLLAPVQWHPDLGGPSGLEDYVAAQAYAAALIAERCPAPEDALGLETETFFGGFRLAPDGLQVGHELSVVQWCGGRRKLV